MIDALHAVRVPSIEEEALRDLVRARENLRGDLMCARQRLSKLLLRHDILYDERASTWTAHHRAWLGRSERLLGAEHPNTLTARANLAHMHRAAGRSDDADRLDPDG